MADGVLNVGRQSNGNTSKTTSHRAVFATEAAVYLSSSPRLLRISSGERACGLSFAAHGRPGWISSQAERRWL
jgi:hypothetical protein